MRWCRFPPTNNCWPEEYKEPEFRASLGGALSDGVKRVSRLINQMRFLARDGVEPRDAFPLAPLIEEATRKRRSISR